MVEIDANGMTIYSVEKIRLKKEDILMFVFPGRLHPEQLKNFTNSLPNELQKKVLCIDNSLKIIHVDNEINEEIDMEED